MYSSRAIVIFDGDELLYLDEIGSFTHDKSLAYPVPLNVACVVCDKWNQLYGSSNPYHYKSYYESN